MDGFTLTQTKSSMVKVCEILLSKMNLGQFFTNWRLGAIMKDASTDSKETMGKLHEFMGNDTNVDKDDRNYGNLLLNTLDSLRSQVYLAEDRTG